MNEKTQIRPLQAAEYAAACKVIRASFATVAAELGLTRENCPTHTSFLRLPRLRRDIKNGATPFGYFHGKKLLGYVSLTPAGEGDFVLNHLAVLPEFRHCGIGKELLDFCKAEAKRRGGGRIELSLIEENTRLKQWYTQNGFVHSGTQQVAHLPFTVGHMCWEVKAS